MSEELRTRRRRLVGVTEALVSAVGFGFIGIVGKAAFAAGFTPGEQLALRFAIAATILWIYGLASLGRAAILPGKDAVKCLALGVFGYTAFSSLYFAALAGLTASLAVLLLYTYPAIVALAAWLFLQQHPGRRKLASLVPVMGGLGLLVWGDVSVDEPMAVLYGLLSALLYASYILVSSRLIAHVNPVVAVCYIQTGAAMVLSALHLAPTERLAHLATSHTGLLLATAILCTVMPMLLFLRALQKLSPTEVSMLSTAEPITGVLAAALVLGERLSVAQLLGACAVVGGLMYMARGESVGPPAAPTGGSRPAP